MANSNQLATTQNPDQQGALEVRRQVNQIQYLLKDVLIEGEHYGKIPGVDKPSLMQSGAEKICYMFKLVPRYTVQREDIAGMPGHREYTVTCTLIGPDGLTKGEAVASCTTMESRYRYRNVADYEDTGERIPKDYKARKQEYRRQGLGAKKVDGQWLWVRFKDSERQENPDIADTWNTVLQMAEKRAFVRATRSTTAASDIFTQDVEDMPQFQRQTGYVAQAPQQVEPAGTEVEPAWLDAQAARLVALGYDEGQTRQYLSAVLAQQGQQAAQAAADGMAAQVERPQGDTQEVDAEYEDVEL